MNCQSSSFPPQLQQLLLLLMLFLLLLVAIAADPSPSPNPLFYTPRQYRQARAKADLVFREATESRFMERGFVTLDSEGNVIINTEFGPNIQPVIVRVKDGNFNNLFFQDLFKIVHQERIDATMLWTRLTLCYALAAYKDELSPDAPLQFRFQDDCQEPFDRRENLFRHASIRRDVHQLRDRINQCYLDRAYAAYSSCLLKYYNFNNLGDKVQDGDEPVLCEKRSIPEGVDGSYEKHIRKICTTNQTQILRVFGADIKLRIKEHQVQFFEIDACFLPKAFESGALTFCFNSPDAAANTNIECETSGQQYVRFERVGNVGLGSKQLRVTTRRKRPATTHNLVITVDTSRPSDELQCHHLVFNRYMLANEDKKDMEKDELFDFVTGDIVKRESLGKGLLAIPVEWIRVMGRRDEDTESGDMISITVKNSFENIPEHSRYSEFFLRIGSHKNLIKCYHAFEATGDICNNNRGTEVLKCNTTLPLGHIRTDTSSERENKTKAELKVHSQTAGSKVEEEQQTTTVGSWSTSHSSAMKSLKYDQQTSTSGSLKHEYAANPGESIQLFQLIFTCGGHKIRLKQTEQNVVRWDKHDASGQLVLPEPLQLPKGDMGNNPILDDLYPLFREGDCVRNPGHFREDETDEEHRRCHSVPLPGGI